MARKTEDLSPAARKLNVRDRKFCELYSIAHNRASAYTGAGFKATTPMAIAASAARLLGREDVQDYLSELHQKRSQRLEITGDRVLLEVARIAYSNIGDVLTWDDGGINVRDSKELNEHVMAAIAEVSESRSKGMVTKTVKMHDKKWALSKLMQYLGINYSLEQLISKLRSLDYEVRDKRLAKSIASPDDFDNEGADAALGVKDKEKLSEALGTNSEELIQKIRDLGFNVVKQQPELSNAVLAQELANNLVDLTGESDRLNSMDEFNEDDDDLDGFDD
ncbi:MAG: terminase small subunit [Crinalium sp.]